MLVTLLALGTACGLLDSKNDDDDDDRDDESGQDSDDTDVSDSDDSGGGGGDCEDGAFQDATSTWSLPSGYGNAAFVATSGTMDCATGKPSYVVMDLTGDEVPDLVVTRACDDSSVGTSTWRVHAGGGDGFAETGTSWSLPSGYGAAAFVANAGTMDCANDAPSFVLADLAGDGRADLVVTRSCDDATVGDSVWRVHANTGSGFGAASGWTMPTGYGAEAFIATSGTLDCADDTPTFLLGDLDGDDDVDMIVTAACDDATVGTSTWRVHAATGAGFGAASAWTLPSGYGSAAFAAAASTMSCANTKPAHTLADLDGDGLGDLVVTQACDDTTVGTTSWRLHGSTGSGFGTGTAWAMPSGYGASAFIATAGTMACANTQPSYVLADLAGVGAPDLLVTRACDDTDIGGTSWRRHPGAGAGFSGTTSWGLPAGYGATAFVATSGTMDCATDAPSFTLVDLVGDGLADLVVTRACDDSTVGTSVWRLHAGGCG